MKIHSLGNDYAHQRKQKQIEAQTAIPTEPVTSTKEISETNAGDKIQTRGEGTAMATTEENSTSKKSKKKKETGTENEQPKDESPVS